MKRGELEEGWAEGRTEGIHVILKAMVLAGAFSWYGLAWQEGKGKGSRGDDKRKNKRCFTHIVQIEMKLLWK